MRDVISNETIKEINEVIDEILTNIDDNVRNIVGAGNYSLPTIFSYTNYSGQTINVHGSTFRHEVIIDNADGNNLIGDICTVIGDRRGIKLAKAGVEDRHDTFANYWDSTFDIAYNSDTAINGYVFDMHSGLVGEGTGQSKVMSFKLDNLGVGRAYTLTFRGKFVNAQFVSGQESLVRICSTTAETPYLAQVTLEKDTDAHIYRIDFTNNTQDTTLYLNFWFYGVAYDTETFNSEFIADDLIIAGMNIGIISRYIDYNGKWYPIEAGGGTSDLDAIELTYAEYQALSPAEKTDPDKIYFITDYPSGSGVVINPTGTATDTAETIEVDGTIYDFMDVDAVHTADIGVAGGVAELDSNGKVPSAQLPTYPTVGDGTITIQKNGTNVDNFSTNQSSNKTINITMSKSDVGLGNVNNTSDANKPISTATQAALDGKADTSDIEGSKTATGSVVTVTDAADIYAEELSVDLEPQQDLHGYDKPWVGGAGKNKFTGNFSSNGLVLTMGTNYTNSDENTVLGNSKTTSPNGYKYTTFGAYLKAGTYTIKNFTSGVYVTLNRYAIAGNTATSTDYHLRENGYTFTSSSDGWNWFSVERDADATTYTDINFDGKELLFQIEEGSSPTTTYAPYSNISPIQGYDIVSVDRCGKNLFDGALKQGASREYVINTNKLKVKPNTTYYWVEFNWSNSGSRQAFFYTKNNTLISYQDVTGNNFTTPANCALLTIQHYKNGGLSVPTNPQIVVSESLPTQFEPYNGQTVSLQLGNKNLLPMTVEGLKAANTSGTWSGNVYSINNGTVTVLTDENGLVTGIKANGTFNATTILYTSDVITSQNNKPIKLSGCPTGGTTESATTKTYCLRAYDSSSSAIANNVTNNDTDVTPTNGIRVAIIIWSGYSASNKIFYPMLRDTNIVDPTFSPYNPSLGGMVYGGQLTLNDDGSAVFVGDKASVDLGTLTYYKESKNNLYRFHAGNLSPVAVAGADAINCFSDIFKGDTANRAWGVAEDNIIGIAENAVYIRCDTYSSYSGTDFATAMKGHQACYELATPFTIHLSAEQLKLLQGTNNVWSNAGNVTLKYQPDNVIAQPKGEVQRLRDDVDLRLVDNACKNISYLISLGAYDTSTGADPTYSSSNRDYASCKKVPCKKGESFSVSSGIDIKQVIDYYWDNAGTYLGYYVHNFTAGKYFSLESQHDGVMAVSVRATGYKTSVNDFLNFQLERGSSPTAYEEYYPSNRELAKKIDEVSQLTTTDNANYNTALNISAYDATKPIFGYVSVISDLPAGGNFYIPFSFMKNVVPAGTHNFMAVQGAFRFMFEFTDSPRSIKMVQAIDGNGNDATTNNTIKFYLYRNY